MLHNMRVNYTTETTQLEHGFPSIRHEICYLTTTLLTDVCHDVCIEPGLKPVSNKPLTGASANHQDGAQMKRGRGLLSAHSFLDIRAHITFPIGKLNLYG